MKKIKFILYFRNLDAGLLGFNSLIISQLSNKSKKEERCQSSTEMTLSLESFLPWLCLPAG